MVAFKFSQVSSTPSPITRLKRKPNDPAPDTSVPAPSTAAAIEPLAITPGADCARTGDASHISIPTAMAMRTRGIRTRGIRSLVTIRTIYILAHLGLAHLGTANHGDRCGR